MNLKIYFWPKLNIGEFWFSIFVNIYGAKIESNSAFWYKFNMSWQGALWPIPLSAKPTVLQTAEAVHGDRPVDRYKIKRHWSLHLYQYSGEVSYNGMDLPIRPGFVSVFPPGDIEYKYKGRSVHLYAHFTFPSEISANEKIPAMQDLGKDFDTIYQSFTNAISCFSHNPRRTEVAVWDILWRLSEGKDSASQKSADMHPAVKKILGLIETNLGEHLRIADMAKHVGLSHNHLTRLFQDRFNFTVVEYIRKRRAERARRLLVNTSLPIKFIASEVGIKDLHLFNKTIRKEFGVPPRKLRKGIGAAPGTDSKV